MWHYEKILNKKIDMNENKFYGFFRKEIVDELKIELKEFWTEKIQVRIKKLWL